MIEPLVMLPNEVRGGYQVDGDTDKIVTLVRLAAEMGADIIKADPTENVEDFHRVVEAARVPVLVRGGGKEDLKTVLMKSAALIKQGAKGMVYGRNIYQHSNPGRCACADGDDSSRSQRRSSLGRLQPWLAYLLGLDAGNTVIKAVLFDPPGRQVGFHALDGATHKPSPGMVERYLAELWDNAKVDPRLPWWRRSKGQRDRALGCAGHGNGLYILDGAGRPGGIQSLDRARPPWPQNWMPPTALRSKDLSSTALASANAGASRLAQSNGLPVCARGYAAFCKDVLTLELTGKRVTEISDMTGAGFMRLPEGLYDDDAVVALWAGGCAAPPAAAD